MDPVCINPGNPIQQATCLGLRVGLVTDDTVHSHFAELLYVSDSWVVTGDTLKVLKGFHHRAVQRIMGLMDKRKTGGE